MNDNSFRDDIRAAVDVLRRGGIIVYPTDTVWGIGSDATSSEAVRRVFALKQRADAKALITLVGSLAQLERTVDCIPEVAYQLIEYSERPVTIVYDHPDPAACIAPELLAEDGTIGVRVTTEPFSRALCEAFCKPLVSTSANISGHAHAACRALDHADCAFKRVTVEIGHFRFCDFLYLRLGELADLYFVGRCARRIEPQRLFDKHGCGGRFENERERTVLIDRDHDGNDEPVLLSRFRIELFGKARNVDSVGTERRTDRGSRSGFTCGKL